MKTILILLVVALPAAFILAPLSFEVAVSLLFAAGFVGVALYDYTRTIHPWADAPALRRGVRRHRARLGLAA